MVNNTLNPDSNSLIIYQQNICGLMNKTDELISSTFPVPQHILCLTEHRLKDTEINQMNTEGFKLCTAYCRKTMKKEQSAYLL